MTQSGEEKNDNLKENLLNRKRRLWDELRHDLFDKLGEEYSKQFDTSLDMEELAIIDLIEDIGIKVADIKRDELERIDLALGKIAEGTYGVCDGCSEEIDEERLRIKPFALFCVKCKAARE